MKKVTLYHNPRCSKSREALALLESHRIKPDLRLYLENPLNKTEIKSLLSMLDLPARALLRSNEDAYKELNLADPTLSEDKIIAAIVAEPRLLQRPIAVVDKQARIGRPPETILELLA